MSVCTSAKTVLHTLNTIWKFPDPLPSQSRFSFSFPLPSHIRSTTTPLPPSYATVMPGLAAECRYTVRVDMYRKGLRRHETYVSYQSRCVHWVLICSFSIKAAILYLPRSTPPAPSIPRNPSPHSSPVDGTKIKWKMIEVSPESPSTGKAGGRILLPSGTVDPKYIIKFTLPEPLVYASASTIPFTLTLRADSPVVPRIFTDLDVYLIKQTVVFSGAYYGVRDGIIGTAELHEVDDEPPECTEEGEEAVGWKVFRGSVTSKREGGETSWEVPGVINMKVRCCTLLYHSCSKLLQYFIGIRIRPSTAEPTVSLRYTHKGNDLCLTLGCRSELIGPPTEPIKMVTHPSLPHNHYAHDPVLGLIAVPGSSGIPIQTASL